ncbi:hypothetical protein WJ0W_007172 [Paenibacillus melissococcoides]|uniref:Uncharacterized protein n=1 Tax=Paenibacillus melissococcoides TaxID=2912268 RepID=A0ABM9G9S6_9BACL|nr:hypothetical protein [Paenibacillus melissococcoides]CAH8248504.1 hypothetical protein WJ0W_007172 [Paenibacillus melissococcoides]CAH8722018.1 hypothetical protein HTL2_006653 [Paenibacillus melissococcoides]CAH8722040.1 hypothetical protein WDD9_006591 [Paenibacillus melissococcoides]
MNRVLAVLLICLLFLPSPAVQAAANDVYLDDYYYAHAPAGVAGTFPFKTKSGSTSITFPAATQGISAYKAANTKDYTVRCQVGGTWKNVTVATGHLKADPKQATYTCELETNGEVEAYGAVRWAGDVLNMETRYYLGGSPTQPGDGSSGNSGPGGGKPGDGGGNPGNGGDGGGEKPGPGGPGDGDTFIPISYKAYYVPNRDEYRMDYVAPTGTVGYKLVFRSSSGKMYEREYTSPTGIHYLTCNGTYYMEFYNSSGKLIGKTDPDFFTSQISSQTCASYGEQTGYDDLNARYGQGEISWDDIGADVYEVWKEGNLLDVVTEPKYATSEPGGYTIIAQKGDRVAGQSDLIVEHERIPGGDPDPGIPPGGGCGEICDQLAQLLACPGYDQFLGDLESIMPKPPDWYYVAGIFRDTIVPAMGDEIVRRAPEVAVIVADEFQRREKPVSAPQPLKPFRPNVPTMTDMPSRYTESLDSNVPDFQPDFSESKPFSIPDPMDLTYDNEDKGYEVPPDYAPEAPQYERQETDPEPDQGYQLPEEEDIKPPAYQQPDDDSLPEYKPPDSGEAKIPDYQGPPDDTMPGYENDEMKYPGYHPDIRKGGKP